MIGGLSEQRCRRSNTDSTHFCLHFSRRTTDDNLRQRDERQRLTSVRHLQATYIQPFKSSNNPHKSTTWVRSTVPSLVPVRSSRRLPRYESPSSLRYTFRQPPPTAIISPDPRNSVLIQVRYQVEPQEKKKTPKGRAKKRITYTRRFVNVTMTGGKRKVRTMVNLRSLVAIGADKAVDEPQPYLVNEFRIWSLRDGAKTGTWIAHSLATPSIHYWAARPFPSPGIHDDDSKIWRTCMADQLLFVNRNKCRRKDWFISGVFGSFFTTSHQTGLSQDLGTVGKCLQPREVRH
ncbi:hypothetical protein KCU92_g20, partial [Aureobasidium melanogenum]